MRITRHTVYYYKLSCMAQSSIPCTNFALGTVAEHDFLSDYMIVIQA